jgi:acetyl esterase
MAEDLDPDCLRVLQRMGADLAGFPAAPTIEDRRAVIRTMTAAYGPPPAPIARMEDRTIDTPAGPLPLRIYWPEAPVTSTPLLLHIHGGGWSIGDPVAYERVCRGYCQAGGCIVVDVHYRRAPENKYPAALEDCEAALRWAIENAEAFGADPHLIAVTGDSAGGNLAAALCQRSSAPILQILVYPVMSASPHASFASRMELGDGRYFLRHLDIKNAELEYLHAPRDGEETGASPLLASDEVLARLPPTLIITAELDPLRDEGEAYAKRLHKNGVAVEYRCVPGAIHAFVLFAGMVRSGAEAIETIGQTVRALAQQQPQKAASAGRS